MVVFLTRIWAVFWLEKNVFTVRIVLRCFAEEVLKLFSDILIQTETKIVSDCVIKMEKSWDKVHAYVKL